MRYVSALGGVHALLIRDCMRVNDDCCHQASDELTLGTAHTLTLTFSKRERYVCSRDGTHTLTLVFSKRERCVCFRDGTHTLTLVFSKRERCVCECPEFRQFYKNGECVCFKDSSLADVME